MKIALTPPQMPNSLGRVDILLALSRTAELGRFEWAAAAVWAGCPRSSLHLPHKTHTRKGANQLAHFQVQQRAGQLRDRKFRAFRERIDLHGRISPE